MYGACGVTVGRISGQVKSAPEIGPGLAPGSGVPVIDLTAKGAT